METTPFSTSAAFSNNPSLAQGPTKTYYPRTGVTVAVLVVAIAFALIVPGMALYFKSVDTNLLKDPSILIVLVLGGILSLGLGIYVYQGLTSARLTVGPDGIEFSGSTHSVKTKWENALSIGTVNVGSTVMKGLLLNSTAEDIIQVKPYVKGFLAAQPVIYMLSLLNRSYNPMLTGDFTRVIPLNQFQPHWETNELGDLIRLYAPWVLDPTLKPGEYSNRTNLLEDSGHSKPSAPAMKPVPARFVFAIMVLLDIAAFLYLTISK